MRDHNVLKLGINNCTYVLKRSIYLFSSVALLGLCCCVGAFSRCSEQGPRSSPVRALLTVAASFGGLGCRPPGFGSCSRRAQPLGLRPLELWLNSRAARTPPPQGVWAPPGAGIEPGSLALLGGFLTTGPRGKPQQLYLNNKDSTI